MKIPPSNHFYDVQEASIKLVYGAVLEHRVSLVHLEGLSNVQHEITIFTAPKSNILLGAVAFRKFSKTKTPHWMIDTPAVIPDGTTCVVTVTENLTNSKTRYNAIAVPNVIRLPVACDLVLLLIPEGTPNMTLANPFSVRQAPDERHMCSLKFETHDSSVKAQVNAINTLCFDQFSRWHPILLNHDYAALGFVDVFKDVPKEDVEEAYQHVHTMKEWNPKQRQVFHMLRNVPGNRFAFIEGIFGCGKTLVQATLAKLLSELGRHVLVVAPTNAAVQAISETMLKNVPEVNAVRVVFAGAAKLREFGQHELSMFHLLQDMAASQSSRYDVAVEHDLHTQVQRLVDEMSASRQSLKFEYLPKRERIIDPNADTDNELELVKPPQEYDAITVYNQFKFRDFRNAPRDRKDLDTWKQDKNLFGKALHTLQGEVISRTRVLLCTQQLASSKLIRHNFARENPQGIVIIADEDGQCLEPMA